MDNFSVVFGFGQTVVPTPKATTRVFLVYAISRTGLERRGSMQVKPGSGDRLDQSKSAYIENLVLGSWLSDLPSNFVMPYLIGRLSYPVCI